MNPDNKRVRALCVCAVFALSLIGLSCCVYLLRLHLAGTPAPSGGCHALGFDCAALGHGTWGAFLGIPLGGWGLVHFSTMLAFLALAVAIGEGFYTEGMIAAFLASGAAAGVGAVLTILMLSGHAPVCPLCLTVHAVSLLLVPAALGASGRTPRELAVTLRKGLRYIIGHPATEPVMARWKVSGIFTAAFVGIIAYLWVQIQVDRAAEAARAKPSLDQVLSDFDVSPVQDLPSDPESRVCLTVFCDFECPYCRKLAKELRLLRFDHPQLAIAYRHFPLSSRCNPAARVDLHPGACRIAQAAEAARRQGRFWEFHDAVFASTGKLDDAALLVLAKKAGLDIDRFNAERDDAVTKFRVDSDVQLSLQLKVDGTPTVFVNGRSVAMAAMPFLREIIEHEFAKADSRPDTVKR